LVSAQRRRVGPRKRPLSFSGRQMPSRELSSMTIGASLMMLAAVKPASRAAL
jgi:hypothetical protein